MAENYLLRVTAGPSYDPSTHQQVLVNGPNSVEISSEHCTARVNVRIQNYRGLPRHSPTTSSYFKQPSHEKDQYSIAFTLIPHTTIPGTSLVFGNDFDSPVRDRLPPGFQTAFKIVKWAIDPGLDGDVYADKPYLYGNVGSSINILRVGEKVDQSSSSSSEGGKQEWKIPSYIHEDGIEEGGDGDGEKVREEIGMPKGAAERKKWFLEKTHQGKWAFERGRVYRGDFFNPYLDFNQFALKLPGFSLSILGYLNGKDSLRYVLKNKETGDVLFVVVFTLLHADQIENEKEEGSKETGEGQMPTKEQAKGEGKGEEQEEKAKAGQSKEQGKSEGEGEKVEQEIDNDEPDLDEGVD